MKLVPMESIVPEGTSFPVNPFHFDLFAMGTQLSDELYLMHYNFPDQPLRSAYLINVNTGECNQLVLE